MHPTERDSELVVELAKTFMSTLQQQFPGWSRAFFRFSATELHYGSKGSVERDGQVTLLSAIKLSEFFEHMNRSAHELWQRGKKFQVLLLTVQSDFDYRIDFELVDLGRWEITKLNGASGLPVGVD